MVHRNVKKALNLAGMEIYRQHPPGAGLGNQIGPPAWR